MDPLARQAQRILAGWEDATPGLAVSPGWLLTLTPGAPQAGSVGYHGQRFAHYISEAIMDGGVLTQDRQIRDALMGLGVYTENTSPPVHSYARAVLLDNPVAYWRLGESGHQRIAQDAVGSQPPNLLNNPSFEADTVDFVPWATAPSSITMDRQTSQHFAATASLRLTGTTAASPTYGEISAYGSPTLQVPITSNQTYTLSGYVMQTTGPVQAKLSVIWYTAGGVQLRQDSSLPVTSSNTWQRLSLTAAAPSTAAYAQVVLMAGNATTATTFTAYFDALQFTMTSSVMPSYYAGNGGVDGDYFGGFVPNIYPNPSFEADVANYTATNGTVAQSTAQAFHGTHSAAVTSNGAGVITFYRNLPNAGAWDAAVTAGQTYTFSFYARAASTTRSFFVSVNWYASGGSLISNSAGTATADSSSAWTQVSAIFTAPVGAVAFSFQVSSVVTPVSGEVHYIDAMQVVNSRDGLPFSPTQAVQLGQASPLSSDADTSVLFDGFSGYVDAGVTPASLKPTGALSCEAWFKTSYTSSATQGIIGNYGGGSIGYILRLVGTGQVNAWVQGVSVSSPLAYSDNNWHHAVITWDGTTIRVYVDGALKASTAFGGPLTYGTNHLELASYSSSAGISTPFVGQLDELAVYNYALSAAQVQNHYNSR